MLTPSDFLNTFNFNGQLSRPPFSPYALLTLNNLPNLGGGVSATPPFVGDDKNSITPILDNGVAPDGSLDAGKVGNNFFDLSGWLSLYFKDMALLSLALVLLAIGLYMLANSTETGRAAIGAATKAAIA